MVELRVTMFLCGILMFAELDFYSDGSLQKQSAYAHVATIGHNIMFQIQLMFAQTL
jgi:hypothetical protein